MTTHSILLFFFLFHNFLDFDIHRKIIPSEVEFHLVHALSFIRFGLVSIGLFIDPIFLYFGVRRIDLGIVGILAYFVG